MRFSKVRIDEGDGPGRGMDLSIEVNESDDEIKLVRFRDDKGDEVAARVVGSSMSSREDGRVIQCVRTWRFERELETVTVEVEYWSEVRTVKVPFAETVGLGMPPPPAPPQNKQ